MKTSASPEVLAILVVDDEALACLDTVEMLTEAGYNAIPACDAEEGLSHLDDDKAHIQAIITDIQMPGRINGYGLAWHVYTTRPDIALIVVSGHVQPDASQLPPTARFLAKPLDPDCLVRELESALQRR